MGLLDEQGARLAGEGLGQLDAEGDGETEAGAVLADGDLGGDGDVAGVGLGLTADKAEGAGEARRVAGREELLGLVPCPLPPSAGGMARARSS
ncbi:hypothetical protein SF23_17190 [Streptomyces sp. MBRL 10]|nr:hypothetical protein SF23_17190 [Streptomyces sp. MBRL 10]